MVAALQWAFGLAGLFGGVGMAVAALLALASGAQAQAQSASILAFGGLLMAWLCHRGVTVRRRAARALLADAPMAAPVPVPELVLEVRWITGLFAAATMAAMAAGIVFAAFSPPLGGKGAAAVAMTLLAGVLLIYASTTLALLRRAWVAGGMALLDPQGFRHVMFPVVPWPHVRGIDVRMQVVRNRAVYHLVLAVSPDYAREVDGLSWRRFVYLATPWMDEAGRLTVPLNYVEGDAQRIAGQAMSIAQRWGARLEAGWKWRQEPPRAPWGGA